ncbi:helix-turn-helix domain-containing protein [Actinomadura sp. 9N407]|uniref:helix-turn-helix domain-containing protein n=1 Tax=Actinomadura sp. 9N407 TaxID=3375154 RepID=UPI0037891BF3
MQDTNPRRHALRLLTSGFTLAEVHRQTGIPLSTLSRWRLTTGETRFRDLATCPRCHGRDLDPSSYSYLLGLYLGDGHIVKTSGDKGVHRLETQHGPGRNHTRKIELVAWQQKVVDGFTEEFIRGLLHSDGCRSTNRVRRPGKEGDRWYEYPRYFFSNVSTDIQRLFTDALDRIGIPWTQANKKNISVARKEGVARLDEFVGPKH